MVSDSQNRIDDLMLLRQAEEGKNSQAVNEVLFKYREPLVRMIALRMNKRLQGRLDASDIVQEVFIEAIRALKAYLDKPQLPVKLWLRHLAGQKIIQAHRTHLGAQKRNAFLEQSLHGGMPAAFSESLAHELSGNISTPSQTAVNNETKQILTIALDRMDDLDREVLSLRHFEYLTSQETASLLGLSNDAVKKRYVRALEKLKNVLASLGAI